MSYHVPPHYRPPPASASPYALVPLGQTPPLAPVPAVGTIWGIRTDVIVLIVVVLVVIAVLWWLNERDQKALKPNRSRAKKQSTAEMAKNLYKRLETRDNINDTTLRSLQQIGRKA